MGLYKGNVLIDVNMNIVLNLKCLWGNKINLVRRKVFNSYNELESEVPPCPDASGDF